MKRGRISFSFVTRVSLGSRTSLQLTQLCSFFWLRDIPLYQSLSCGVKSKRKTNTLYQRILLYNPIYVYIYGVNIPMEKERATHPSAPAWRIPWMEEPGGLQLMGSQRVGHD